MQSTHACSRVCLCIHQRLCWNRLDFVAAAVAAPLLACHRAINLIATSIRSRCAKNVQNSQNTHADALYLHNINFMSRSFGSHRLAILIGENNDFNDRGVRQNKIEFALAINQILHAPCAGGESSAATCQVSRCGAKRKYIHIYLHSHQRRAHDNYSYYFLHV